MANEIDFLKSKKKNLDQINKWVRRLNVFSLIGLIVYCLVVAGTIFYLVQLKNDYRQLADQVALKKQALTQLQTVESSWLVLKQRLGIMTKYLDQQTASPAVIMDFLNRLSSADLIYKKIVFGQKANIMISGQALDAVSLSGFLDRFEEQEAKKLFKQTLVESLSKQQDGSYVFNLTLTLYEKS